MVTWAENVKVPETSLQHITRKGGAWDLVQSRVRHAQERHPFCVPRTPETETDAPRQERENWKLVSQQVRSRHFAREGLSSRGGSSPEASNVNHHHHRKKLSLWDKVRGRSRLVLEPPSTLSSPTTAEEASSQRPAARDALAVEIEDGAALDTPRWKQGWQRRKKDMEQGHGGPSSPTSLQRQQTGLICTSKGARHAMAACGGLIDRLPGPAQHNSGPLFPRESSDPSRELAGLTSYYKYVKSKYPNVRTSTAAPAASSATPQAASLQRSGSDPVRPSGAAAVRRSRSELLNHRKTFLYPLA